MSNMKVAVAALCAALITVTGCGTQRRYTCQTGAASIRLLVDQCQGPRWRLNVTIRNAGVPKVIPWSVGVQDIETITEEKARWSLDPKMMFGSISQNARGELLVAFEYLSGINDDPIGNKSVDLDYINGVYSLMSDGLEFVRDAD